MVLLPQRFPTLTIFGRRRGMVENRLRDKVVVQDYVGRLDEPQSLDGKQVRVSGAGSYQKTSPLKALNSSHPRIEEGGPLSASCSPRQKNGA